MVAGGHLFFAKKNGILNDEQHLAEMVSLMGPPPPEFLRRSDKCRQFWDEQGMMPLSYFILIPIVNIMVQAIGKGLYPYQNSRLK